MHTSLVGARCRPRARLDRPIFQRWTVPNTWPVSSKRRIGPQISKLLIVRGGPVWRSPAIVTARRGQHVSPSWS
jgi:hypothetical protein